MKRTLASFAAVGLCLAAPGCCDGPEPAAPAPTATVAQPAPAAGKKPRSAATEPSEHFIIAFIAAEPEVGPAPLRVQFGTDDPYQRLQSPQYRWEFGDGSPGSDLKNPVHVYERPGNYEATLVVTEGGATDEDSVEIQVEAPTGEAE